MAKPIKTKRPLSRENAVMYGQIVGLELALLECNEMGLEVKNVEWDNFKPRLVVRNNQVTTQLLKRGKAFNYGRVVRNGQYRYLNQMILHGVKVIWESVDYRH